MITREAIEKRIVELKIGLDQLQANFNAYRGAIEDCEHWLKVLAVPDKPAPPPDDQE